MADLLELVVSATASGCIYALVALAYLLILRPTSVINFAVGEWAATGAFIGVAVLTPLIWPRMGDGAAPDIATVLQVEAPFVALALESSHKSLRI